MAKLSAEDVSRITTAFNKATLWHAEQVRKGTDIPYLSHLMAVSSLVLQYGGTSIQAAAALLHDSIEDAKDLAEAQARKAWILDHLGREVLDIVLACSDGLPNEKGVKPPWKKRKIAYLRHLPQSNTNIWLVSCCDKLHNAQSIVDDLKEIGNKVWKRFNARKKKQLWYYGKLAKFFVKKDVMPAKKLSNEVRKMIKLSLS
ncbi:MAG: HD domain-containing protein [Syntrophales bacterium]